MNNHHLGFFKIQEIPPKISKHGGCFIKQDNVNEGEFLIGEVKSICL